MKARYKQTNLKRDLMFAEAASKATGPRPKDPNYVSRSERIRELKRVRKDQDLNWNWVQDCLDNGMTLDQAKTFVRKYQAK